MYTHNSWVDSSSKEVNAALIRGVPGFVKLLILLLVTCLVGFVARFILPEAIAALLMIPAAVLSYMVYRGLPTEAELLKKGLVADYRSFAFRTLSSELAQLHIYIQDMNDTLDYEVGTKFIVEYLRETREATVLIDKGNLKEGNRRKLEHHVTALGKDYAGHIRWCFDQRELARQAKVHGEEAEARRLSEAAKERCVAFDNARAEILLTNYLHGIE